MKKLIVPILLFAGLSFAQLDPGDGREGAAFDLFEAGNHVGQIFVPAREPGTIHYLEHWVLFPNYVYPGPKNLAMLKIVPKSPSPFKDEADFFRRVEFKQGSKYIRVTADEYHEMPRAK